MGPRSRVHKPLTRSEGHPAAFVFGNHPSELICEECAVADGRHDMVLEFMRSALGYQDLEMITRIFHEEESDERVSRLQLTLAFNEFGRKEDTMNEPASAALGKEIYGRAMLIFEEEKHFDEGDDDCIILSIGTFLDRLEQRGAAVPHYPFPKTRPLPGRLQDVWTHWQLNDPTPEEPHARLPATAWRFVESPAHAKPPESAAPP